MHPVDQDLRLLDQHPLVVSMAPVPAVPTMTDPAWGWVNAVRVHATRERPNEAVGALIGCTAVPLTNVAPDPRFRFAVDPTELISLVRNPGLWGFYHSHTKSGPRLSGADRTTVLAWPSLRHVVCGVDLSIVVYAVVDDEIEEVGRY